MKKRDSFIYLAKGVITGILSNVKHISPSSLILSLNGYEETVKGISNPKKNKNSFIMASIPLLFGIIIGYIAMNSYIDKLWPKYSEQIIFLFIGLLLGGIKVITKKQKLKFDKKNIIISVLVLIIGITLLILTKDKTISIKNNTINALISSLLINISLIIPGASIITGKLNIFKTNTITVIIAIITTILVLFALSNIMNYFLKKNKNGTYILLCTLTLLNLIYLIMQIDKFKLGFTNLFTTLLALLWGYIFAKNVEKE